jgi:hypothetical protein
MHALMCSIHMHTGATTYFVCWRPDWREHARPARCTLARACSYHVDVCARMRCVTRLCNMQGVSHARMYFRVYVYLCMYIYVCVYVYMYICIYINIYIYIYIYMYICMYIYIYIYIYIHTYICTYIHTYGHACMHTYITRTYVCMYIHAHLHACIHISRLTNIYTIHIHTVISGCCGDRRPEGQQGADSRKAFVPSGSLSPSHTKRTIRVTEVGTRWIWPCPGCRHTEIRVVPPVAGTRKSRLFGSMCPFAWIRVPGCSDPCARLLGSVCHIQRYGRGCFGMQMTARHSAEKHVGIELRVCMETGQDGRLLPDRLASKLAHAI